MKTIININKFWNVIGVYFLRTIFTSDVLNLFWFIGDIVCWFLLPFLHFYLFFLWEIICKWLILRFICFWFCVSIYMSILFDFIFYAIFLNSLKCLSSPSHSILYFTWRFPTIILAYQRLNIFFSQIHFS